LKSPKISTPPLPPLIVRSKPSACLLALKSPQYSEWSPSRFDKNNIIYSNKEALSELQKYFRVIYTVPYMALGFV
jgi:hypothetical protein